MLESFTLWDFQRYKKITVDLDPHVTTFVGPTDCGKSTLLRALRWLAFNKPAGLAFIRHGAERAVARLTVDGRVIKRRRSKAENCYVLDGKKLHAIGQGVPEQIAALLNVDAINFATQHQNHFLFAESAGEVARALNAVVNLGAIDQTLANLAAGVRQAKAVVGVSETRLSTARNDRDRLAWVPAAEADLLCWEQKIKAGQELRLKAARLRDLLETSRMAWEGRDRLSQAMPAAQTAAETALAASQKRDQADRLAELVRQRETEEREQCRVQKELKQAEAELAAANRGRCPLCERTS